ADTLLSEPASVNVGVPVIVAVRGDGPAACAVNVNDAGFPDCVIVRLFEASGSVAVAVIVATGLPSAPLAVAGAVIDGAWFVAPMVRTVVELAVALVAPEPSLTVNTMLYDPAGSEARRDGLVGIPCGTQ